MKVLTNFLPRYKNKKDVNVKLPAHRAGLAGHVPVKLFKKEVER